MIVTHRFVVESEPNAQDVQFLEDRLHEYNDAKTGMIQVRFGLDFPVGPGEGVVISAICGCTKT